MASSADAIQSFLERYEQSSNTSSSSSIAHQQYGSGGSVNGVGNEVGVREECAHCCCGNASCAYLKQNQRALDGLEKDVRTAAQFGQVCEVLLL